MTAPGTPEHKVRKRSAAAQRSGAAPVLPEAAPLNSGLSPAAWRSRRVRYEHARAHVAFHYRYYNQFPVDTTGASVIVDINDSTVFSTVMREELSSIDEPDYDRALAEYKKLQPHDFANLPGDKIVQGFKSKDRKSTRLNSSHSQQSRMPSSA